MIGAVSTSANFPTFLIASLILAITPGPGAVYLLTQRQFMDAKLACIGGRDRAGRLGNAIAALVGLAAVFAISSVAFFIVQIAGTTYLIY